MAVPQRPRSQTTLGSAGLALLIGAVGGVFFLFGFPGGAISTLMHQVLKLPGPGAGIALVLGPVALVFMLASSLTMGRIGGASIGALGFSLSYGLLKPILERTAAGKGAFGSGWFIVALLICGLLLDGLLMLTRRLRPPVRFVIAACGANTGLLVFYWTVIFPRTAGWVAWKVVPVLLMVCLVGGALAAVVGWAISTRVARNETFIAER